MSSDGELLSLRGTVLVSARRADTSYRLQELLGEGAYGVVFLATEERRGAAAEVVVKLLRPRATRSLGGMAAIVVEKEVTALQRLSNRFPPTPHVVRFLDTGVLQGGKSASELMWIAIEYVNGGSEGVTLRARVEHSKRTTGHAFERHRAGIAARAMFAGAGAIHDFGVVHRDIGPSNVLCSGSGEDELFKIADFGIARIASAATFGSVLLGTPGYCAPEQSFPDKIGVGTYSDVFGLACTLFFVLTGEQYLAADNVAETLVAAFNAHRPRLLDAAALGKELKGDAAACAELDRIIASATHADPRRRVQTARELGKAMLPLLSAAGSILDISQRAPATTREQDWHFGIHRPDPSSLKIQSVGIDSDGQFLAVTDAGNLVYWDGLEYRPIPLPGSPRLWACQRVALRHWLLAGAGGMLADFEDGRITRAVLADDDVDFVAMAGSLESWLLGVGRPGEGPFELWTSHECRIVGRTALSDYGAVAGCVPLDARTWLVAGTTHGGDGIITAYDVTTGALNAEQRYEAMPIVACASRPELRHALFATAVGSIARYGPEPTPTLVPFAPGAQTACAIDSTGREWLAHGGELWTTTGNAWTRAGSVSGVASPVVAVRATPELVSAVREDGVVLRVANRSRAG